MVFINKEQNLRNSMDDKTITELSSLLEKKRNEQIVSLTDELEEVQDELDSVQSELGNVQNVLQHTKYELEWAQEEVHKAEFYINDYVKTNHRGFEVINSEYLELLNRALKEYKDTHGSEIEAKHGIDKWS